MLDKDTRPLTDNERAFLMEDDTDDTRREDEPGDWVVADFDGECSRNVLCYIFPGDTIRADGDGGWECRECVDSDGVCMRGEEPIGSNVPRWTGSKWRDAS
jgi:hypothetical protein